LRRKEKPERREKSGKIGPSSTRGSIFGASHLNVGRPPKQNVSDLISEALSKMGAIVCCVSQEPPPTKEETEEDVKQDYREVIPPNLFRSISSVTTLPIHMKSS
jgi:hypothetical protein